MEFRQKINIVSKFLQNIAIETIPKKSHVCCSIIQSNAVRSVRIIFYERESRKSLEKTVCIKYFKRTEAT